MSTDSRGKQLSWGDRYWAWIFRRAEQRIIRGLPVGLFWPSERDRVAFERVDAALALLEEYDQRRLERLHKTSRGILVFGETGALAQWIRGPQLVMLQFGHVVRGDTTIGDIACSLVHESTHAWLESLGFGYEEERRARIEAICFRAEQAFARKLPESDDLIARAQRQLARETDYWTNSARQSRDLKALRELGVPAWLVSVLGRIARRRAA